jgi:hypothetical protein
MFKSIFIVIIRERMILLSLSILVVILEREDYLDILVVIRENYLVVLEYSCYCH